MKEISMILILIKNFIYSLILNFLIGYIVSLPIYYFYSTYQLHFHNQVDSYTFITSIIFGVIFAFLDSIKCYKSIKLRTIKKRITWDNEFC